MKNSAMKRASFEHDLSQVGNGLTILVEEEQSIRTAWEDFFTNAECAY